MTEGWFLREKFRWVPRTGVDLVTWPRFKMRSDFETFFVWFYGLATDDFYFNVTTTVKAWVFLECSICKIYISLCFTDAVQYEKWLLCRFFCNKFVFMLLNFNIFIHLCNYTFSSSKNYIHMSAILILFILVCFIFHYHVVLFKYKNATFHYRQHSSYLREIIVSLLTLVFKKLLTF